jgi:hypothetical protein
LDFYFENEKSNNYIKLEINNIIRSLPLIAAEATIGEIISPSD